MKSLKSKTISSAPGKLMILGEHAVVYGYPAIVTAVDQRLWVSVEPVVSQEIILSTADLAEGLYRKPLRDLGSGEIPKNAIFVESLLKNFQVKFGQLGGMQITTRSEFSPLYGFGSSSAVTVALAKALAGYFHLSLSHKELFDVCFQTVIDVQGVGSGFDIAAAIWGGTIYYVKPAREVRVLSKKELPLVVGYTGIKADTTRLVNEVAERKKADPETIEEVFAKIGTLVNAGEKAILNEDWKMLGRLMDADQQMLDRLGVSCRELDALNQSARERGAYGAKLSGAGGGDCMIAIGEKKALQGISERLSESGGQVVEVKSSAPGVRFENL